MIISTVRFKNFFSSGNQFLEFDLLKFRRALVTGPNGTGKSTLLNAITFGLFGKTLKQVNKPQIINSINKKDCVVEIEGHMPNGTTFKVVRGIKPNIFEIYVNGELVDQKLVGDYQDYLETEIIRTTFRTFTQTSILSIENYKPFMSLTASERRAFIEDILDIKVFSIMDSLVKAEVKKNKESLRILETEIAAHKEKIVMLKNSIEKIESMSSDEEQRLRDELNAAENDLKARNARYDELSALSDTNNAKLADLRNKRRLFDSLKSVGTTLKGKLQSVEETLVFFEENDICPTCKQPLEGDVVDSSKTDAQCRHDNIMVELRAIAKQMQEYATLKAEEDDFNSDMQAFNAEVIGVNNDINSITRLIAKINNRIDEISKVSNTVAEKQQMKELAAKALDISNTIASIKSEQEYNALMTELFKDSGIKSKIVEQYIPVINTLMNGYLEDLDLFVSFELDSEFNETIKSRHRDNFSYDSFSMGQRQRIDLAIMFTMRDLAVMKNSFSCNILGCDEVLDAAVDVAGVGMIVEILLSQKFADTNLLIVSHRSTETFEDICDGRYNLYMRDGFTQVDVV